MGFYRRSVVEIRNELSRQAVSLAAAEEALDRHRAELAQAMKQRKALERLEEKLTARAASGRRRQDQKDLDEMHAAHATGSFGRDET